VRGRRLQATGAAPCAATQGLGRTAAAACTHAANWGPALHLREGCSACSRPRTLRAARPPGSCASPSALPRGAPPKPLPPPPLRRRQPGGHRPGPPGHLRGVAQRPGGPAPQGGGSDWGTRVPRHLRPGQPGPGRRPHLLLHQPQVRCLPAARIPALAAVRAARSVQSQAGWRCHSGAPTGPGAPPQACGACMHAWEAQAVGCGKPCLHRLAPPTNLGDTPPPPSFPGRRYDGTPLWDVRGVPGVHALVWVLNLISFYFLYPSTFNILEASCRLPTGPGCCPDCRHPPACRQPCRRVACWGGPGQCGEAPAVRAAAGHASGRRRMLRMA